jgi:hypothetical protein
MAERAMTHIPPKEPATGLAELPSAARAAA